MADRTVAASLAGLMAPVLEAALGPYSFAYRPGRGYLDMLAWIATVARAEGRWVIGNHDVARAFPSVPLDRVIDAHRQHIEDRQLLRFIEVVLRGATGKRVGLSQGSPYSPTAMELFMHTVLDSVTVRDPTSPPGLRYSDNVVYLTRSVPEGQLARDRCQRLLSGVGLSLKKETNPKEKVIADLTAGEGTQLLGFTLGHRGGEMTLGVGRDSWESLAGNLDECHLASNPPTPSSCRGFDREPPFRGGGRTPPPPFPVQSRPGWPAMTGRTDNQTEEDRDECVGDPSCDVPAVRGAEAGVG